MAELAATFENSWGKRHVLHVSEANTELAPEEIKASLEKLTTIRLFKQKGARLFDKVVTASFFEEIETMIFDNEIDEETVECTNSKEGQLKTKEVGDNALTAEIQAATPAAKDQVTIVEECLIAPNILKQVIELPKEVELSGLNQDQLLAFVVSVIPEDGKLTNARLDEGVSPARIELFVQLANVYEEIDQRNNSSPPERDRRKGWRLLDRWRKRR